VLHVSLLPFLTNPPQLNCTTAQFPCEGFQTPHTEAEILKQRLKEAQQEAQKANEARLAAEARYRMVAQDRDVHRLLARRFQSRLSAESQNQSLHDELASEELMSDIMGLLRGRFTLRRSTRDHLDARTSNRSRDYDVDTDSSGEEEDDDISNDVSEHDLSGDIADVDIDDDESHDDNGDGGSSQDGIEMDQSSHEMDTNEISMEADGDNSDDDNSDDEFYDPHEQMSDDDLFTSGAPFGTSQNLQAQARAQQGMTGSPSTLRAIVHRHQTRAVSFCGEEG